MHRVLAAKTIQAASPTPTITISPTQELSPTDSPTTTPTQTPTPTVSPSPTLTPTVTLAITPTLTPSLTPDPTVIPTRTPTDTPSPTPSLTPTVTITPTLTPTATPSLTPVPTDTPTPTLTPSPSPTVSPTQIPSLTPTTPPTVNPTNSPAPSLTLTLTPTPTPTDIPSPTISPTEAITPTITATPTATLTPSITPPISLTPSPTPSFTPTPTPIKIGNDISYPQCGKTLPTSQGFGIVGINDGIATTTNPCLSAELLWAEMALGTPNQSKVQLYVNTGNPGGLNTASWPHNNADPHGNISPNPYGTCDGSDSLACSWQYGWNRAVDDVDNKFIPAAQSAGVDPIPADYPWWLDVETANSWESGSSDALQKNQADLEAMVTYLQSRGITVGIYSTAYQWNQIVGSVSAGNLNGLHSWLPGAQDLSTAQSNCSLSALTSGGSVTLTQYTTDNFDYDYSCL